MDSWNAALDALPSEAELNTTEQKLAYANVLALLAIGQELNALNVGESKIGEAVLRAARTLSPIATKR